MREHIQITASIQRATNFLAATQLSDGGFESFSSPTQRPFKQARTYLTTFAPALILQAVANSDEPTLIPLRKKLAAWLLTQRSPNWSFNYWATAAPERAVLPYPDDLDDTFCALLALYEHDPALIDATCLGKMVNLLIATESTVGGPYRTWLVGPKAPRVWRDVDLAVNANIAYFLRRVAQPLPNLDVFMENAIAKDELRSPYYPSAYPLLYYLARGYKGQHTALLRKRLLANRRGKAWGNPLNTALAVTSLLHLGEAQQCEPAIKRLIAWQKPDGSWPAAAFCLDPSIKGHRYLNGSPALTTALVIEALARYQNAQTVESSHALRRSRPPALRRTVLEEATNELDSLAPELRQNARTILKKMAAKPATDEIMLLAFYYNQSLKKPSLKNNALLTRLGVANLFGWMAYTVYDDYLDEQRSATLLPVASLALRRSLAAFRQALPKHDSFQKLVADTFDIIDGANAWEITHCRFKTTRQAITLGRLPDFGNGEQLAERSLGHMLTPLGVLTADGHNIDSQAAQNSMQIFKHYLVARQLNDDMHDWEADVRAGRITYVVAEILRGLRLRPGTYSYDQLIPAMKHHFWHHTAGDMCQTVLEHIAQAQELMRQNHLLTDQNKLTSILDAVSQAAARTLEEQTKARDFLAAYQDSVQTPTTACNPSS